MSHHPTLGHRPPDMTAGFPIAAERLKRTRSAVAARALQIAVDLDPTLNERHDEPSLSHLLRDLETYIDRLCRSIAGGDPRWTREWADWVSPLYRRRRIPMADLVTLSEGLRQAASSVLEREEREPLQLAIDEAITVFRWYGRLAGDARKRNRILDFFYRGA